MNFAHSGPASRPRGRAGLGRLARAVALAGLAGCQSAPPATVTILNPSDGSTVTGPAVHIMLAATGVEIAPVAEGREGTAHHHLYLDTDLGDMNEVIPAGLPGIVHLGLGQAEFHWDSLSPGPHRIIAVLADVAHRPLQPLAVDTVRFVVAPPDTAAAVPNPPGN